MSKEDLYRRHVSQATGKREGGAGSVPSLKGCLGKEPLNRILFTDTCTMSHPHTSVTENLKLLFPYKLISLLEWKILF